MLELETHQKFKKSLKSLKNTTVTIIVNLIESIRYHQFENIDDEEFFIQLVEKLLKRIKEDAKSAIEEERYK